MHTATCHLQRHRILTVLHGQRLGDGGDAILHRADVLEDAVDGPHDPAGHVVDADHQTGRQSDRADGDVSPIPQPQCQAAGTCDEEPVDDGDGQVHAGGDPGLRAVLDRQFLDRIGDIGLLAAAMGEQLQRGNVGVAVDDASHRLGARLRRDPGTLLRARHEVDHDHHVGQQPQDQRHHQPPVGLREQVQRGAGVDDDVPKRIDHLHRRLAQRGAGLHHPVGHAAGEVVLEEAQALPHHVVVHQPARAIAQARHDGLVDQQVVQADQDRARDDRDEQHPAECVGMALEEVRAGLLGDHVDDAAEEIEHRHFHQRQQQAGDQGGQQHRPHRSQVVQVERHHGARRHAPVNGREHRNQGFKPTEHRIPSPSIAGGVSHAACVRRPTIAPVSGSAGRWPAPLW
ncbi:hypothetical protein D3C81_460080 [compost metagenome]